MKNPYLLFFLGSILLWITALTFIEFTIPGGSTVTTHSILNSKSTSTKQVSEIYYLFGVSLAIITGTFFISLHPEKTNYPYEITDGNRERVFKRIKTLMSIVSLATTLLLMSIAVCTFTTVALSNSVILISGILVFTVGLPVTVAMLFREDSVKAQF